MNWVGEARSARGESRFDALLGRLQFWLQGVGHKRWPWCLARVGNAISDWRFSRWERRGGSHPVDLRTNAATNVPPFFEWTPPDDGWQPYYAPRSGAIPTPLDGAGATGRPTEGMAAVDCPAPSSGEDAEGVDA